MARDSEIHHPQQKWAFRFADRKATKGWQECTSQARANACEAWVAIVSDPRRTTGRQHRLKGSLASGEQNGRTLERWQYEITSGGRLWYLIDEEDHTVWLILASLSHPKATE